MLGTKGQRVDAAVVVDARHRNGGGPGIAVLALPRESHAFELVRRETPLGVRYIVTEIDRVARIRRVSSHRIDRRIRRIGSIGVKRSRRAAILASEDASTASIDGHEPRA